MVGPLALTPLSLAATLRRPHSSFSVIIFASLAAASLARALAGEGHDVFIVECRGVGFSRPWRSPSEWADKETNTPRQHAPTFGDFDYDTYLREDLPAACGYVAAVTGEKKLGAVGHSMGGMLVMNLASGAVRDARTNARSKPKRRERHSVSSRAPPFLLAILRFILAMLFHRRLAFLHLGFRSRRLALFRPGVGICHVVEAVTKASVVDASPTSMTVPLRTRASLRGRGGAVVAGREAHDSRERHAGRA